MFYIYLEEEPTGFAEGWMNEGRRKSKFLAQAVGKMAVDTIVHSGEEL